jgi:uncharacterized protein (TIGR02271 family)
MAQTVIGMFDNASEAQEAVQKLTSKGFSRDRIDVSNSTAGSSDTSTRKDEGSGIGNFFRNLFNDDDETDKYSHVARHSQSLVTVHAQTQDEAEDAADILDDCGAVNVDERAASLGYSGAGVNSTADRSSDTATTGFTDTDTDITGQSTKIPIIEENLEVGKREVLRGGTRIRSRIVERPVEESLRLREETVRINRNPVDRAASTEDLANFSSQEIEMRETAEVPVVSKEARVVEEVSLGKEVNERTETVSDTVRKTEVDVEDLHGNVDQGRTGYTNTNNSSSGI